MTVSRTTEVRSASRVATEPTVGDGDATLVMAVRGSEGVAALEICTGWFLPNALVNVQELDVTAFPEAIVGFHSPTPIGGDLKRTENCPVLKTETCWGDGSSIAGRYLLRMLLLEGDVAVWRELEELYSAAFERTGGLAHMEVLRVKGRAVTY